MVNRFDVFLINLDPLPSADPKNTRPCVVLSPDEMNRYTENVIVAPLSGTKLGFPTRIPVTFLNSERSVVLDQLRSVDKVRLVKKIGSIDAKAQKQILDRLCELFSE